MSQACCFDLALVSKLLRLVVDPNVQQPVELAPLSRLTISHADEAGDISLSKAKALRGVTVFRDGE